MALPLEGIRIADLSVVWAGPYAAALLGDMGAEVIRVESIQRWDRNARNSNITADQLRANGGSPAADAQMWDLSSNQNSVGRNKKNVTMDLTRPEGREVFFRLIAKSDVFVENNQPELLDHLGIGMDRLFEANQADHHACPATASTDRIAPSRVRRQHGSDGPRPAAWYTDTDPR